VRSILISVLATLSMAPQLLHGTAQIQNYMMTKTDPIGACSSGSVVLPIQATNFSTTDKEAFLWFRVTGANAGDVFASEYYTPSGQYYAAASGAWNPLPSAGNYCFADLSFPIANNPPASLPGTWTVRGTVNGAVLFTITFTISPTTGTGLNVSVNQVIDSNCPNNRMIVSVTNSAGAVTGLTAANFTLKENGVARAITVNTVTGGSSGPLSLAIVIDLSGSLGSSDLANEKAAAKALIAQMGASDLVAIYSFSDDVNLRQDFTTDKTRLNAAVDALPGGGNTALYKAIQTAANGLAARTGRKALVLMTDGEDTMGGVSIDQAIAAAKSAGTPVFPVGFASANTTILTRLATETGGFYSPSATSADLQRILSQIGQVITSQYEISYTATVNVSATVEVTVTYSGQTATTTRTVAACGSGSTTGLTATINQVITTTCPNNKVIVSVTNAAGAVTGLTAANFTLKENGVIRAVTVNTVTSGSSGPLSLAIVIDLSGSLSSTDLANEKTAAKALIAQMGASDLMAIYSFSDDVNLRQDFTTDKTRLNAAVDALPGGGNTALYKAIQTAANGLAARAGRKALVLMTDGEDTMGGVSIDQAIAAAKSAGTPVFPVGFGSANTTILTRLATETGGFYSPSATSADLQRILVQIGQVITSQYEVSYSSAVTVSATVELTVTYAGQTVTTTRTVSACGSGSTSGLTATINQVITTACPNNKMIVSVTNAAGAVTGLTAANFTLKESGSIRAITVSSVTSGSSGALSLAILIDVSGSLSSTDLANEKTAAKALIAQMSGTDQVAVYSFTDDVRLLQDFTTDKTRLNTAVDSASGGGSTALYKAIQTASQALGSRTGRKAIVLMTDGEDTIGGVTIDQAIAAAKTAGVPVFPVGFGSANTTILTRLATETGGFYSPSGTSADLQRILSQIGLVITSQYEVSYTSTATVDATVEITVSYGGQTATTTRTVAACSGGSSNCTYLLQPQSLTVAAAGATGTILVITQAGCQLNPSATVSWIHILGFNTGAVSYQVDPNTSSSRSGFINIGNRTVLVTQDGGVSCAYSIAPLSNVLAAQAATSSFRLTTGTGCPWNVVWSGSWVTVTSATSGSGAATIIYKVEANTSTQPRNATITVAGRTFTLTQNGGASATAPTISQGGIVNAASNRAGTVARGSFFTIYGTNIGPPGYQQVQNYPIPETMGGVLVTFTKGSYSRRGFLHFVSAVQVNGILPSDVPLGDVQVTVSYNGVVSSSETITVIDTSFGTFSAAGGPGPGIVQNYNSATDAPLNMPSFPAKPKQIAILWGTGLGPITTPDYSPPPGGDLPIPVEISVGGKLANRLYSGRAPSFAGVDNIYFEIPADAPLGCSVPVQVKAGGLVANTVRIAISADGKKCQDSNNPFGNVTNSSGNTGNITTVGGNSGIIGLARVSMKGQIDSSKPAADATFDVGFGGFGKIAAGGDLAFSSAMNLPPAGSCVSSTKALDFGSLMATNGNGVDRTVTTQLDAGKELTITGPKGTQKLEHTDSNSASGPYVSMIGGTVPVDGAASTPLFLDPGSYTISGPGGKDVGAFSTTLTLAPALVWANQAQVTSIDRNTPLTITWSGGDPSQTVAILGGSSNQKSKQSGSFYCFAPASAGSFVIPANILVDLQPTGSTIGTSDTIGMLAVGALPMSSPQKFTASGLDSGMVFYTSISAQSVTVK
jgi:uncharacterized protein (TIGR03437 family)